MKLILLSAVALAALTLAASASDAPQQQQPQQQAPLTPVQRQRQPYTPNSPEPSDDEQRRARKRQVEHTLRTLQNQRERVITELIGNGHSRARAEALAPAVPTLEELLQPRAADAIAAPAIPSMEALRIAGHTQPQAEEIIEQARRQAAAAVARRPAPDEKNPVQTDPGAGSDAKNEQQ